MADKTLRIETHEGQSVDLKLVDNGDGTFSFNTSPALPASVTVGTGQVGTAVGTIADGDVTGLSGAIDLGLSRAARICMPAAWTAANLTFQTSLDAGVTWNNFYDVGGNSEYTVVVAASRSILLPLADFFGIRLLKIRSGTSSTPVAQGGNRTITLQTVPA